MQLQLLPREITPDTVLIALQRCNGAANGMTASQLALQITGRQNAADERRLRSVIGSLRLDGHPVCATPDDGYFLAVTADELNRTCVFLTKRAATSFRQVAAMKRVALPDFFGQLGLPQPDNDDIEVSQ